MNLALTLLAAAAGTLVLGILAKFIASLFTSREAARVAGFSVAVGYVLGQGSYEAAGSAGGGIPSAVKFGALLGLAVLWYLFMKRPRRHPSD
jgi:hypothetical protein